MSFFDKVVGAAEIVGGAFAAAYGAGPVGVGVMADGAKRVSGSFKEDRETANKAAVVGQKRSDEMISSADKTQAASEAQEIDDKRMHG